MTENKCAKCGEPATHHVVIVDAEDIPVVDDILCDQHTLSSLIAHLGMGNEHAADATPLRDIP